MLLHGAGDRAANMLDAWKRFTEKQKIVRLAPEPLRDAKFEDAAPGVFRCIVEDAKHFVASDARRVYRLGNSMGGYLAYDGVQVRIAILRSPGRSRHAHRRGLRVNCHPCPAQDTHRNLHRRPRSVPVAGQRAPDARPAAPGWLPRSLRGVGAPRPQLLRAGR
jgi:hypothetical protein